VADIKVGLALLDSQLSQQWIDGQAYWFSAATRAKRDTAMKAYLLPVFDEYTVAYKDRSAAFASIHKQQMGNALSYVIVLAGKIVGAWKHTLKKDTVVIEINPFKRLTTSERRAVSAAAQRYGDFLQLAVVVT
jgi:DNA glycosylase AlkZ-like